MSATGTLTTTDVTPLRGPARPVEKLTLAWTSNASGAVDQTTTLPVCGAIVRVVFVPGTSGSQPTNGYTVLLKDEQGLDVLEGVGNPPGGLSNATTTEALPLLGPNAAQESINDKLELVVAGAGNTKSGSVILYIR